MDAKQIAQTISFGSWTNEDINLFIDAIKFARTQLGRQTRHSLRVGDSVKFTSNRNGLTYRGTVDKIKIKYVLVNTAQGRFNVPANMVEAV